MHRFWNNDVLANIEGVLAVITKSVGSRKYTSPPTPTPDPSPPLASLAGGGE